MINVQNPLIWYVVMMILLPLAGSLIAGLLGNRWGRVVTHRIVITLVAFSFFISCYLFFLIVLRNGSPVVDSLYTWATVGMVRLDVSFLLDKLSAAMCVIVLFVSLMVHIYTIGYMADDPGYQQFFSYVSLFTFSMLVLVLANNFLVGRELD